MKCILVLVLLAATAVAGLGQGVGNNAKDSMRLKQIQQQLIKAWVSKDRNTINSLLADDWSVTDPSGRVLTKAQVMAEFDSGDRKLESGTIDDVDVRLFGNVAVVTGRTTATGSYQGNTVTVKLRFTDVFLKRNGRWRAVASQATVIAE